MTAVSVSSVAAGAMLAGIRGYQLTLRPVIGAHCRFHPSCSHYAMQAIRLHGPLRGGGMAAWRILRCNPWHCGGDDPVPGAPDFPARECRE